LAFANGGLLDGFTGFYFATDPIPAALAETTLFHG
jgi:hypothetical protein